MADTKKVIGKVSLTPRGAYDPAADYTRLDVVQHEGCGYIVLADNIQGVTPEDGENYMLLASGTEIDDTLTVSGKAADAAAVGARLSSLSEEIANIPSGGSGMTTAEKTAMLTLFKAAAYISDVSAIIADLETLWDSGSGDSGGDSGSGLSASYSNGKLTLDGVTAVYNSAALYLSGVSAAYNNGVLTLT